MAIRFFGPLIVLMIASSVAQAGATYTIISGGTCSSRGYQVIEDMTECRVAGVQVGYQHFPYGITGPGVGSGGGEGLAHPYGCFHGTNLAFNYNSASIQKCDSTCICKVLPSTETYATISGGTCSSSGYQVIGDVDECRVAGVQLGYQHFPYGITGPGVGSDGGEGLAHPYGCFHGTNLAFNYNEASISPCDSTCICKRLPSTTTTLTTTTSPTALATTTTTTTPIASTTTTTPVPATSTTTTMRVTSTTTSTTPKTTSRGFLSTTPAPTTTLATSCVYKAHRNMAVKNQGTGGKKLLRKSYRSEKEYLDACKAECNGDRSCGGFVDDRTSRRRRRRIANVGRMCKPKTASVGYRKAKKTFYVKGSECSAYKR